MNAVATMALAGILSALPAAASLAQTTSLPAHWIDNRGARTSIDDLVVDAQRAAAADELWVGYAFALREGVHIGCEGWRGRSISFEGDGATFYLDRENEPSRAPCDDSYGLFLRFREDAAEVVDARLMSWRRAAARLEGTVVWSGVIAADDSVTFLRSAVLGVPGGGLRATGSSALRTRERLLSAVAVHDSARAPEVVLSALESSYPRDLRESAVFWAAQVGGDEGLQRLIALARGDGDAEVREQSVFWLAHAAGERATSHLADIAADDPDTEVRKAAVFALSQSDDDAAIDALIDIVREHDNREVVQSALFWLGQSGDARAVDLIEELLFGRRR
jgi:hypothetical protein